MYYNSYIQVIKIPTASLKTTKTLGVEWSGAADINAHNC